MIHNISTFIAALALLATAAQGAWAWDGSGTAESPYQIKSTADLDQLATDVNSGTEHEGDYFVLTTDLTYSHTTDWNDANSTESNYTPIGGQYDQQWRYFNGHFDGQGHTISGIRIYKSGGTTAEQCMGLFGRIKGGADVKNVFLADARITANDYSGPIVGYNNGRVENCHVLSDVTIHAVTASADNHGGVVGFNTGTITGCTSAASITAAVSCKYNGGITGRGSGTVEDCIYFGSTVAGNSYVGAIIGYASSGSSVRNCYYINDGIASAVGGYIKSTIDDVRLATSDDFAVSGDTYTIGSTAGWSVMCAALYHNDTFNRFSGKTVQLGADITVTRMAGGENHAFTGTFDGGDHTLTLAYGTADAPVDAQFVAPFLETASGTSPVFRNLTIAGTIYDGYTGSEAHNIGGLIGHLYGTVTIEHCTSLVEIHAKVGAGGFVGLCEHDVSFNDCHSAAVIRSADGSNSGFVAWSRASAHTIAFTGCLFDGKLLQQNGNGNSNGGFIGWTGASKTVTFTNCLCAPAPLADGETMASSGSATFARGWNATTTATNCFDTAAFEIAQGKATRTVAAAADVTIGAVALTGTATQYTVSGITAYSGGGLQLGQTLYYGSGDQLSLTLSNTATGAPQGYQYGYTASAGTLSGSTLTMPDQDVTISVNTAAILSTGQPVTVAYIKADGTTGEANAIALDGTETSLAAGWYFVGLPTVQFDHTVVLDGDVNLILCDGCEMKVGESGSEVDGYGIIGYSKTLDIYAQSLGDDMGALSIYTSGSTKDGIRVKALTVNGGNITADANGSNGRAINTTTSTITVNGGNVTATSAYSVAIHSADNIYINGGTVNVTGSSHGIGGSSLAINGGTVNATCTGSGYGIRATGSLAINGGNVTATSFYAGTAITLGWTRPADRITVSSISTPGGGTVAVADGQALTDGSGNIYTGTLTASVLSGFAAETTLQPCLALADAADNTAAIADHAGKTLAVALSGRTLYKDGSWNTLCLPFSVSTASGTLSGDNVQAMTLNTETSSLTDGTLTLNFDAATTIPAGTPFIIKWDKPANYVAYNGQNAATCSDLVSPVFDGVTVSNATNDATVEGVLTFTGTYAPVTIGSEGDNTKLYLGAANKLYYPTKAKTIGTHRAYFQLADGITAGNPVSSGNAKQIRAFNLNFFDDEATGILTTNFTNSTNSSNEWYSLDGRMLNGKPTAKGLYIHGGKKVIVK